MSDTPLLNLNSLKSDLETAGLNLCTAFSAEYLADSMPELALLSETQHLLLIGNYGNVLWQVMPKEYLTQEHPVDGYTADCITRLLQDRLSAGSWSLLFPQNPSVVSVSLQALGRLAGWHYPSPLGIGINQNTGLWFAYRAVVALNVALEDVLMQRMPDAESPCISCEYRPCLTACPAGALEVGKPPDLSACVSHRVTAESSCASTCVARVACPVATQWQYKSDQLAYYYERSLPSLKAWVSANS